MDAAVELMCKCCPSFCSGMTMNLDTVTVLWTCSHTWLPVHKWSFPDGSNKLTRVYLIVLEKIRRFPLFV